MYEIAELINGDRGKNYPSKDKLHSSGIPFISAINLEHGTVVKDKLLYLSEKQYNLLGSGKLQKDDLIFCLRGSLGKNGIYPFENGAIASSLVILRLFSQSLLNLTYFNFYINSPLINSEINKHNNGTAQPNLSAGNVAGFYFPLPPLNEQHRIVAKIEELLPFIEQYDQKEQQLTALNKNFPEQLKKSILQAAIQGKLTEQLPTDEPASELLKRIQAEKARLISEKKVKKPKHSSEIIIRDNLAYEIKDGIENCIADEIPFEIPESWCWVRLGNIFEITSSKRVHQSQWKTSGIPFYRAREIVSLNKGEYLKDPIFIDNKTYQENIAISGKPEIDDILVTGVGTLGQYFVVKDNNPFYFKDGNVVWFRNHCKINIGFICIYMDSPIFIDKIYSSSQGTTVGTFTIVNAKNIFIPLPPVEEQKRIVEKVELFMSVINHL